MSAVIPQKTYFNWSSGKDASLALYYLLQNPAYQVTTLLTSVNATYDRISMHGVRRALLEQQAEAIGLPLMTLELPEQPTMEEYEQILDKSVKTLKEQGYTVAGFGDIFLEDLRKYREENLQKVGVEAVFPIWGQDTKALLQEMLQLGFKMVVVALKADLLPSSMVGKVIDADWITALPDGVDPCGENGEFHTFCFDGPIFNHPVQYEVGEKIYKEYKNPDKEKSNDMGFWFCDLIPIN